MNRVESIIKKTAGAFSLIAGASIVVAMVLVVANVILRAVFGKPVLGAYEFTGFLSVFVISFGLAYVLMVNAHIAVDFIVEKFSERTRGYIDTLTGILVLIFVSVFTWNVFLYAAKTMENNQLSPTAKVPLHIFIYAMGVCFLLLCLVYIIKIRESVGKARLK